MWWCAICGEKYDWKQPNRLLVEQTGDSIEKAKVFKAHAVLVANLINALKLLLNQQEDGDGLFKNIVKNQGKENRRGLKAACVNSLRLTMSALLTLDRYAGARELFKFGNRKFRKGARM